LVPNPQLKEQGTSKIKHEGDKIPL